MRGLSVTKGVQVAVTQGVQVALVTGGVRRIGAVLVERLARAGYAVVIGASARSAGDAFAFATRLRAEGLQASHAVADLADAHAAVGLIAAAREAFGRLSLLVNNASMFADDAIATLEADTFDRHAAINLRAPLLLTQQFAAQADAADDPSVINILDQRVLAPNPLFLSYSISKAGLAAATTILAQALAPDIRVNAVAPGPVLPNSMSGEGSFAAEVAQTPLARPVSPHAVADALVYLARARNVTGQTIAVDSGQRLAWRTPDVLASLGET